MKVRMNNVGDAIWRSEAKFRVKYRPITFMLPRLLFDIQDKMILAIARLTQSKHLHFYNEDPADRLRSRPDRTRMRR